MRLAAAAFCSSLLTQVGAPAATVQITVEGVRNARGHVRVAICSRADFLHAHCAWQGTAQASAGDVSVSVPGVPPGTYAAQAFHDEDDNGTLDRNLFGWPDEGLGFSNDAKMFFGPPSFNAAAFAVAEPGVSIRFHMRYY